MLQDMYSVMENMFKGGLDGTDGTQSDLAPAHF